MITVTINNIEATQVMELVRELRAQGLTQGKDFDFKFHPLDWNQETFEAKPKKAEFFFHTEKYATLFAIKYGN